MFVGEMFVTTPTPQFASLLLVMDSTTTMHIRLMMFCARKGWQLVDEDLVSQICVKIYTTDAFCYNPSEFYCSDQVNATSVSRPSTGVPCGNTTCTGSMLCCPDASQCYDPTTQVCV